ncbi:hypothetical protein LCI18_003760 [Fusarium solani-melongenae]|uniref:Uncharacterized protein n=1 Tax=Fusarium solani subsp. cucurbitae TaxID=2747967 RepID=A0ACD3YV70_FUSSC|nr:hypothetical protein LCI18_003760 [Fusarium solani-melongenae]
MLLHSTVLLALASLGASKNFGYLQPPRPVANSSDLYERQTGCNGGAVEIDCDGTCIPYNYDCCRLGDGSFCETLCDPLGGGCKDSGSGGGYGDDDGGDSDGDGCQDGYTPCDQICIPPTGMCCGDGTWCKLGKCTKNGDCDLSEYADGKQNSGSAQTATEASGSSSTDSSSSGKDSDNDEKESSSKEEDGKGGDNKDSDEEASESKDGNKGNDAPLRLPTLAVGLVALVPLLM